MAGGWSKDGAVQAQIDASVNDALDSVRARLPHGESLSHCEECEAPIPAARREALPGVRLCVKCQEHEEQRAQQRSLYNRRASKDSQLR